MWGYLEKVNETRRLVSVGLWGQRLAGAWRGRDKRPTPVIQREPRTYIPIIVDTFPTRGKGAPEGPRQASPAWALRASQRASSSTSSRWARS